MVILIQGKGKRIISLPSGYMRTAHLAGLIKKMKYIAERGDLGDTYIQHQHIKSSQERDGWRIYFIKMQ